DPGDRPSGGQCRRQSRARHPRPGARGEERVRTLGRLLAALLLLGACASPVRPPQLAHLAPFSGSRYDTLDKKAPKAIDKAAVILTCSGGGTRAAALADGALHALADTEVKGADTMLPLASQVDLVSSVSGGSVTAAYFALGGVD